MRTIALILCVGLTIVFAGCNSSEPSPTMSKVVTPDSVEFKHGTAAQDEYVRQAKEAERKALGEHPIE